MKKQRSIAVVGAGITGSVAALSLADEGYRVCLFDKAPRPLRGASFVNEGKIHLGFVYVNDPSTRSLDVMIDTAVVFRSTLERWIEPRQFDALITEPFEYIVPADTQLAPDAIDRRFRLVEEKIEAAEARQGTRYLGIEARPFVWLRSPEVPECYDRKHVVAHYRTIERSVDAHGVARHLSAALESRRRIELHMHTPISRILGSAHAWRLQGGPEAEPQHFGPFDFVINASWEGRLALDEQVFGPDDGDWFHRYKTAINLTPADAHGIPNFTAIIGTYGDVVRYPSGRVYLSWYPAGMLSSSPLKPACGTYMDDEVVIIDCNFTLAGQTLIFDLELIDIV